MKTNISGHYASEIEKLTLTVRQRTEENQKLQQTISQLQSNQDGEFRQLQNSYTLVSQEYENSKKHLIEYEQSIKKLYSEFERLQIIINELKTERQSLFEKVKIVLCRTMASSRKSRDSHLWQTTKRNSWQRFGSGSQTMSPCRSASMSIWR